MFGYFIVDVERLHIYCLMNVLKEKEKTKVAGVGIFVLKSIFPIIPFEYKQLSLICNYDIC